MLRFFHDVFKLVLSGAFFFWTWKKRIIFRSPWNLVSFDFVFDPLNSETFDSWLIRNGPVRPRCDKRGPTLRISLAISGRGAGPSMAPHAANFDVGDPWKPGWEQNPNGCHSSCLNDVRSSNMGIENQQFGSIWFDDFPVKTWWCSISMFE